MNDLPEFMAPGCFGSALTYREDQTECQACPFAQACAPKSALAMTELRARLGIPEPEKPMQRAEPKKRQPRVSAHFLTQSLPQKVLELIERVERDGIDIGALARGHNPFVNQRPVFLRLACHVMLAMPQGVTRRQMIHAYRKKFGWTEGTASALTTQTFQTLKAFGAVVEVDGKFIARRET